MPDHAIGTTAASPATAPQTVIERVHRSWGNVRYVVRGLKVAGISTMSVLMGLVLFRFVPQVQDLLLEIRGNGWGPGFWVLFYVLVLVAWALPVYISAHWILSKYAETPVRGPAPDLEAAPVKAWVARLIPPLLAALCLVAVLAGQWEALKNIPAFDGNLCGGAGAASDPRARFCELFAIIGSLLGIPFNLENVAKTLSVVAVVLCASLMLWLQGHRRLGRVGNRFLRIVGNIVLGLVFIGIAVIGIAIGWLLWLTLAKQMAERLSVAHLAFFPVVSAFIAFLLWWGLRVPPDGRATTVGAMMMRLGSTQGPLDREGITVRLVNPIFFIVLAVSLAVFVLLFVFHPVDVTTHFYRALFVPILLGLLVPVLTYVSHWSRRLQAPLLIAIIVLMGVFLGGDNNEICTTHYSDFENRQPRRTAGGTALPRY